MADVEFDKWSQLGAAVAPWLHSGYLGVKYCRKQLGTFTAIIQSKILAIFS